jgi:drug/metabolite transporter (DMT)-like permease
MLKKDFRLGIAAGISAGALWGLVFLAPAVAPGFSPAQLSIGRYLAYGLVAAVLIAPSWKRLTGVLGRSDWIALIWLSLTGNIVYYVLLAKAVQAGGITITALVVGFLPIAVTLAGTRETSSVPSRQLIPSLGLSIAGLVVIGWDTVSHSGRESVLGLLCAVGALVSWTAYAVGNSRWLGRLQCVSAHEWSLLLGIVTGAEALFLAGTMVSSPIEDHSTYEWMRFAVVVCGLAICCSILGNWLWNFASRKLPLTLAGQMIVFETIFAASYGILWAGRWPTFSEGTALALLVAGGTSCAAIHRPSRGIGMRAGSDG